MRLSRFATHRGARGPGPTGGTGVGCRRVLLWAVAVIAVVTSSAACSASPAPARPPASGDATLVARIVDGADPGPFGTNLEGASFDATGRLYVVDSAAPPGRPKIMTVDPASKTVQPLYSDDTSVLNCLVFGPDGAAYVCDMAGKRVARFDVRARTLTSVLGPVDGTPIVPDDLTFGPDATMYVTDYVGSPTAPTGRIVERSPGGTAATVVAGLVHPNGLVSGAGGLWIDEDLLNRLDHLVVEPSSPGDLAPRPTLHVASSLDLGSEGLTDSLTTDGAGNIYMAAYRTGQVLVFDPHGVQIGRIGLPASAPRPTHVAIQPGTTTAYVTASGPDGGYLYSFTTLAPAPPDQPSGG